MENKSGPNSSFFILCVSGWSECVPTFWRIRGLWAFVESGGQLRPVQKKGGIVSFYHGS
jgi:hypothetical protein